MTFLGQYHRDRLREIDAILHELRFRWTKTPNKQLWEILGEIASDPDTRLSLLDNDKELLEKLKTMRGN